MAKVCPQYNRGQCEITESSQEVLNSGKMICPKHKKPLVPKAIEHTVSINNKPVKNEDLILSEALSINICSRNENHPQQNEKEEKCWCGADYINNNSNDSSQTYENIDLQTDINQTANPPKHSIQNMTEYSVNDSNDTPQLILKCFNIEYKITEFPAYIGREQCFDEEFRKILLTKEGVSRCHIEIEMTECSNSILIKQMKSETNGTFANGERIYLNQESISLPTIIELGNPESTGISFEVKNG